MFNKSIALIVLATGLAHAQGQVDMTGDGSTPANPAAAPAVPVAGVNSSGAPFTKGTLGVSFQMTLLSNISSAVSLTAERVPKIDLLYFLSSTAAVDLVAGFNFHKTQVYNGATPPMAVDRTSTGFAAGAGYRMYKHRDHVATFIEPELVLEWTDVSNSATLTVNALGVFGVEAMLSSWCSLSGSVGGGLAAGNKFKDIQIATNANLAANLYWK
jgi:hypothetical protein